jgi:hypothetical protein
MPSAFKREHPTIQNIRFFIYLFCHFCPLGSGSGSSRPKPMWFRRIRIHNTVTSTRLNNYKRHENGPSHRNKSNAYDRTNAVFQLVKFFFHYRIPNLNLVFTVTQACHHFMRQPGQTQKFIEYESPQVRIHQSTPFPITK